jgi:hypothetical protein
MRLAHVFALSLVGCTVPVSGQGFAPEPEPVQVAAEAGIDAETIAETIAETSADDSGSPEAAPFEASVAPAPTEDAAAPPTPPTGPTQATHPEAGPAPIDAATVIVYGRVACESLREDGTTDAFTCSECPFPGTNGGVGLNLAPCCSNPDTAIGACGCLVNNECTPEPTISELAAADADVSGLATVEIQCNGVGVTVTCSSANCAYDDYPCCTQGPNGEAECACTDNADAGPICQ